MNKLYRLIVRLAVEIASLEDEINAVAEDGYEYVAMYESNARIIVVMKRLPKVGRPRKTIEDE